uniref:Uncharacterized protein n=1 Tax=Anopheles culicifacies TaxID=139723 RepID=A0A182MDH8_9DIPT
MTKDRFTISSNSSAQQAPSIPHAPLSASASALNTTSTASGSAATITVGTIKLTSGGIATITNASIASGTPNVTAPLVGSSGPQGSTTSLTMTGQFAKCPSPGSTIGTISTGTTRSVSTTLGPPNSGHPTSVTSFSTALSSRITAQVPPPTTLPIGSMAARSPTFGTSAHR